MMSLLRFLIGLSLAGVAAGTILPLLWRFFPRATMLAPMAPQWAGAAALLAVLALLVGFRAGAAIAAVILVWNLIVIWPYVSPFAAKTVPGAAPALKVMSFNVWAGNTSFGTISDVLRNSGADVIGLVEMTPNMKEMLAGLKDVYPYSIDCIGGDPLCETMLLSKLPIANPYAGTVDDELPFVATGEVEVSGAPVTIVVTHLTWPMAGLYRPPELMATELNPGPPNLPNTPALAQSEQAANLAAFLQRQPNDLILMGDFNSASWGPIQVAFRAAAGLDERRRLLPTWPSWAWPILRLPIDHVFTRGRPRVVSVETGPSAGSDHFPVIATIAIEP